MARENPTWGAGRIADELKLKLGIKVSPRTVRKYLKPERPHGGSADQRWATFVRNHATAIVACDFFPSVTARLRIVYVFLAMEIGSRRILRCTEHPTSEWTMQQFREILAEAHPYRFVVHDRDAIFSALVDRPGMKSMRPDGIALIGGQAVFLRTRQNDREGEALIEMWKQSQRFDPAQRVPFQAFAYRAVRGAILMACRRRHYRDATHDELKPRDHPTDARPNAEQALLERREQKLRSQRVAYRLQKVEHLMAGLSAADAFLVKRAFIDGVSVETLAELWGVPAERMRRRLNNAVRILRRASTIRSKSYCKAS